MKARFLTLVFLLACSASVWAQREPDRDRSKDFNASLFGIKSDGITLNTRSIQKAIDHIHEKGGGTLVFYVGRYLTGTINLKSNVNIRLQGGAAFMASTSPYDYDYVDGNSALIIAKDVQNVSVTGRGLIEGQGAVLTPAIEQQAKKGNLPAAQASFRPALIYMTGCTGVTMDDLQFYNASGPVQIYKGCKDINIKNITIESNQSANNKGIVLDGCSNVNLTDSRIDTSSAELFLTGAASNGVNSQNNRTSAGKNVQPTK